MITCHIYKEDFTYGVRVFTRKNTKKISVEFIAFGMSVAYSNSYTISEIHQSIFASADREAIKQAIQEHFLNKETPLGRRSWEYIETLKRR